jgi:hypothetical protein
LEKEAEWRRALEAGERGAEMGAEMGEASAGVGAGMAGVGAEMAEAGTEVRATAEGGAVVEPCHTHSHIPSAQGNSYKRTHACDSTYKNAPHAPMLEHERPPVLSHARERACVLNSRREEPCRECQHSKSGAEEGRGKR